jgi:hypothetical protein
MMNWKAVLADFRALLHRTVPLLPLHWLHSSIYLMMLLQSQRLHTLESDAKLRNLVIKNLEEGGYGIFEAIAKALVGRGTENLEKRAIPS